jgi:type VI secretion system protein VasG
VSRCTEAESGGRVIDSLLTNTVLPRISTEYLTRLTHGGALGRIRLSASDSDFVYTFE